jgi:protoporphyrinogen oxidase
MTGSLTGHVGIVGGGILGMYLALKLRQGGARVTLLEAGPATGGLAAADDVGGYIWDRFYHVILLSDLNTRALLEELGIADKLRWGVTRTGFYTDGQLYSLSNNVEFLRFPPLSLLDKVRLGGTIFLASLIRDGRALERVSCEEWLTKWSGRRVVEKIWLPLLKSKLGDNYRIASASFIWAIIARMYAARRSGLKREMFGYVDGGYDLVLKKLQERLDEIGVTTRYEARVTQVNDRGGKVEVTLASGEQLAFDKVVMTVPTPAIAAMCPQLSDTERARLNQVVYQGIVCASMLTKQPLGPYYVTNVTDRWVPFTGVIEMTALVDRERFGGNSLVYLPCYLTQEDPYWQKSDAEVEADFLAALERMYPHFRRDQVVAFKVARARQVLAVSTLDYSSRALPPLRTSLPNVFILNSAQIANGTLNVNETLGVVNAHLPELTASASARTAAAEASEAMLGNLS